MPRPCRQTSRTDCDRRSAVAAGASGLVTEPGEPPAAAPAYTSTARLRARPSGNVVVISESPTGVMKAALTPPVRRTVSSMSVVFSGRPLP